MVGPLGLLLFMLDMMDLQAHGAFALLLTVLVGALPALDLVFDLGFEAALI